ncbi:hypothetical protein LPJ56_001157 [Coemansia sp. RSA 2599]|nr:hypothetical protein LPJ56_001157 [Coemansia sp. RSA 2599]
MSSLHAKVTVWNSTADPTHTGVTAVAAYRDGVACGHADGKIWLYEFTSEKRSKSETPELGIRPKCLLSAHQSPIAVLKLAEINAPCAEGTEGALLSVSEDGDVVLWAVGDGRCISRVRSHLQGIRPTSASLQTMDYQSAAEDLLFVSGQGRRVYVLSYPSLELVHEWHVPHAEWITALAVRKRKDHFRSELITCASDGVMRIWSYDEFALSQQDVLSRTSSPVIAHIADVGAVASSAPMSRSESVSSDQDGDQFGAKRNAMFSLESEFSSLGEDQALIKLAVNPFNEDEFLAVSPAVVRLFASRNGEMHELLRWKAQRTNSADFTGAGFLAKSDIIFWDASGNIFNVCSSFSIEGGSAGMHLTRGLHAEMTEKAPKSVVAGLETVSAGPESGLGAVAGRPDMPVSVLVTYTSNHGMQSLSVVLPVPLSSISGSANRPHVDPEDSRAKPKNWLGSSAFFEMSTLWTQWLDQIKPETDITCALVTQTGRVALGLSDGRIRIVSPMALACGYATDRDYQRSVLETAGEVYLRGHKSAITALFQWSVCAVDKQLRSRNEDQGGNAAVYGGSGGGGGEDERSLLLSAGRDLKINVWDPITGECLYTFPCQSSPIVGMYSVMPLTKAVLWQQGPARHQGLSRLLQSLIVAIGSDNSALVISMASLERVFAMPPYHEQPVRLSLCREKGDLSLWYMDGTKRRISLAHLWGHGLDGREGGGSGESQVSEPFPSYSLSLASSQPRFLNASAPSSNASNSSSNSHGWASIHMASASSSSHRLRGNKGIPPALFLDIEISQLYSSLARRVPDGTGLKEMQQLMADEQQSHDVHSYSNIFDTSGARGALQPLSTSRMLMSVMCTWGICGDVDESKQSVFGLKRPLPNVTLSLANKHSDIHTALFPSPNKQGACWCISPLLNAQRMMAVLILSRCILQGNERKAVEVINYYVGKLPAQVGTRFKSLSLLTLAQYWQSANGNLQRAARTLILSTIHGAPDKLRRAELFYWSSILARCAPGVVDAEDMYALIIVCVIGSDFQSLLPLTARSMAASMLQTLIVADRTSVRSRMVAIELLSRGFSTFKAHIDSQLVIRRLLGIMMSVSEDGHGMGLSQGPGGATYAAVAEAAAVSSAGTRRVVSGASVPTLGNAGSHGSSAPGSRRPSHARAAAEAGAAGAVGLPAAEDLPRPARSGLANTPTNTMNAVARAAVTSSTMRMTHQRTRSRHKSVGEESDGVGSTVSFSLVVLAKSALLRISADNIGLVASTVAGILQSGESIRERRGALQLIGLVAQKYAVLLYPFLETLVAAIVQAIEPKHATARKMLIGAAGAALQGLVRAYPWVSFHPESQCLAVGCIDGRCTTFDLRTATRTAVYDSQAAAPVVAVAISPRGDCVASFVLGSGLLSVWDPSPSALAMFAKSLFWPASDNGASSEPGSGTVTPSKTMVIPGAYLGNKDEISMASLMDVAKLTWTADRTVLLQIHEASFSLSL